MKRGFPRPRVFIERTSTHPSKGSYGKKWNNRSYPWPYSASEDAVSEISPKRAKSCIINSLCGTCGDPVEPDELVGLILYNQRSPKVSKSHGWFNQESGPYHLKCMVINFTQCPHLSEMKSLVPSCGIWSEVRPQIIRACFPSHYKKG